jgi:magnesium transporter
VLGAVRVLDHIERDAIERQRAAGEFFWLDLVAPSDDDIDTVAALFAIHPVAVEDLKKFGQRPKIDDYPDFIHIVFYGMRELDPVEVHLIVHGDALITVRHDECVTLRDARGRVEATSPDREEYAVYRVLDALTDSFFPAIEMIDEEVDRLEERALLGGEHSALQEIVALKRRLTELRRRVGPQRDILATADSLFSDLPGFTGDGSHDYFRDVYDHLLRISDAIESYRDVLTGLLDVYLSAQSNRLNEVVYKLTWVGTIFLPLTFLTGFFGQNFDWLVDNVGGELEFWLLGIGLEILSIAGLILWQRRSRLTAE